MGKVVVVFYNDLTDSDNWLAARALLEAARNGGRNGHEIEIIWIIEPRVISLGRAMTQEQQNACQALIKKYFPRFENAFKALLAGLVTQHDIREAQNKPPDGQEPLSPEDAKLVSTVLSTFSWARLRCTLLERILTHM